MSGLTGRDSSVTSNEEVTFSPMDFKESWWGDRESAEEQAKNVGVDPKANPDPTGQ